MVLLQISET